MYGCSCIFMFLSVCMCVYVYKLYVCIRAYILCMNVFAYECTCISLHYVYMYRPKCMFASVQYFLFPFSSDKKLSVQTFIRHLCSASLNLTKSLNAEVRS